MAGINSAVNVEDGPTTSKKFAHFIDSMVRSRLHWSSLLACFAFEQQFLNDSRDDPTRRAWSECAMSYNIAICVRQITNMPRAERKHLEYRVVSSINALRLAGLQRADKSVQERCIEHAWCCKDLATTQYQFMNFERSSKFIKFAVESLENEFGAKCPSKLYPNLLRMMAREMFREGRFGDSVGAFNKALRSVKHVTDFRASLDKLKFVNELKTQKTESVKKLRKAKKEMANLAATASGDGGGGGDAAAVAAGGADGGSGKIEAAEKEDSAVKIDSAVNKKDSDSKKDSSLSDVDGSAFKKDSVSLENEAALKKDLTSGNKDSSASKKDPGVSRKVAANRKNLAGRAKNDPAFSRDPASYRYKFFPGKKDPFIGNRSDSAHGKKVLFFGKKSQNKRDNHKGFGKKDSALVKKDSAVAGKEMGIAEKLSRIAMQQI